MLPKMSTYRRVFDETKYISFLIKFEELLEKYNEIWNKVSNNIKKGFDSESEYSGKYVRTKRKSYDGKTSKNIQRDKIPKQGF